MEKAILTNTVTRELIPVLFNPEEYTVERDINFAQTAIPGLSAPILQFVAGNLQTLTMELLVDTYEAHRHGSQVLNRANEDVRNLTRRITGLMDIDPTTHAPPLLIFAWGEFSFSCVLARASQRFVLFRPDGTPVRARLQVTFNEFRDLELEAKDLKRETANFTEVYLVGQGETVHDVAIHAYGNPALWRPIALFNAVDDPRALTTGARLVIPTLPFRDPESGEMFS